MQVSKEITKPSENQEIITLAIQGMYCAGCAARIENVLKRTEGIEEAKVNFATATAIVKYNQKITFDEIKTKIQKIGYDANIKENLFAKGNIIKYQKEKQKNIKEILLFLFSLILSLPLILHMFLPIALEPLTQFLLATPVQFIAGYRFHKGAIKTLLGGGANMDVLVSLGTNVAYFYSVLILFYPHLFHEYHVYFESSAVVITFVLLGKILEGISKRKANQAIEDLFSLQPLICHLWKNEEIRDIDINLVQVGDIILVRPGENIPVDGVIIEGSSECNESLITGESLPVQKKKGDKVYSGTMNLSGMLKIQVEKTAEESTLGNILKMVEDAQSSKAPVQKLADIISGYFAIGVIIISILTFFISFFIFNVNITSAIIRAVAVLVIACPCALGLATPIAILISSGIAAKYGILFRNGESIENIGKIHTLIFDKTGTLTTGTLKVKKIRFDSKHNVDSLKQIYRMIYLLESSSEHIIAKSIVNFIKESIFDIRNSSLTLIHLENFPGYGVKGEILEKNLNKTWEIYIGNQDFFKTQLNFEFEKIFKNLQKESEDHVTAVYIYIPNLTAGLILLQDTLRDNADDVIRFLKSHKIEPILATGDKKEIATKIATLLGIEKVYSELKPEDKIQIIEKLQQEGRIVGMIGDGINDAPALSKANVSFAMGGSVTLTKESADVNLIHNDLMDLPFCIYLSKKTLRKIKQNLFFAFIYNIVGIPLATLGYLSPVFAGLAMAMSSVSVVTSSLFLYLISKESFKHQMGSLNLT